MRDSFPELQLLKPEVLFIFSDAKFQLKFTEFYTYIRPSSRNVLVRLTLIYYRL